jgi:succinyl-diaminopimelate desuccinylase
MTEAQSKNARLDETLLWLCSVDSPIGDERALADAVEARLRSNPAIARVVRIGDSIVADVARGPGVARQPPARRPHVGLVGHLDTVRTENGPARLEGGRCFGAGASDMKSGLALMLVLVESLGEGALGCDLSLVFYAREEGPFAENELGRVLAEEPGLTRLDLAVCLEPSDNRLHLGCNGSIHAALTFHGRTGHSARPWEADSAVTKGAEFLVELGHRAPIEAVIDGLTYRTVTTATQVRDGGRGRNVVPDRFLVNLNHRFAPSTSLAQAEEDVRALVAGRADIVFEDRSPAAMPSASHPIVAKLRAVGVRGIEPKQAWTDVARFAQLGVPAINFGPGENAQAHQKDESTSLALLHEGFDIVTRWLRSVGPGDV